MLNDREAPVPERATRNKLLCNLSDADFEAIAPLLRPRDLLLREVLTVPGEKIRNLYYIETGICSVIAASEGTEEIEVGLLGFEGVTDFVMDAGDSSVLKVIVQVAGTSLAITAEDYANWIAERPEALRMMVRYHQAMTVQICYTALAHGSYSLEERLARLLLMIFDRTHGDEVSFVHERLANMLAVRRAGVTTTLHVLEGYGAIRATRGVIKLRNRDALVDLAAGSYGTAEKEYARLLGSAPTRNAAEK